MGINRRRAENWEMVRKLAFVQASSMGGIEATEQEFMPLPYDAIEQNDSELNDENELLELQKFLRDGNS
jgi:hypothetical protein